MSQASKEAPPKNSIGGTAAAMILGKSAYGGPFAAWKQITDALDGVSVLDQPNDYMMRGILAEDPLLDFYSEEFAYHAGGFKLAPFESVGLGDVVRHPEHSFIHGTPDRVILDPDTGKPVGILEFKTFDSTSGEYNQGREDHTTQLSHYACVASAAYKHKYPDCMTGRFTDNYILVASGNRFLWEEVVERIQEANQWGSSTDYSRQLHKNSPQSKAIFSRLRFTLIKQDQDQGARYSAQSMPSLIAFWKKNVIDRVEPPVDSSDRCSEFFRSKLRSGTLEPNGRLAGKLTSLVEQYSQLAAQIKQCTEDRKRIQNEILKLMGSSRSIKNDRISVTLSNTKGKSSLDQKALREEMPEVYQKFLKTGRAGTSFRATLKSRGK